jgi:hypothetical protein
MWNEKSLATEQQKHKMSQSPKTVILTETTFQAIQLYIHRVASKLYKSQLWEILSHKGNLMYKCKKGICELDIAF